MSDQQRVLNILTSIKYKDGWDFGIVPKGDDIAMFVQFWAPCSERDKGAPELQRGRKWLISEHMTDSEIVQTAFLAIKVAEEHEMRENFKFEGQCIFGPHFDLHNLAVAIKEEAITEDRR